MKIAFVAFKGDPLCFMHVLLNVLDLKKREVEVKLIFEGEATRLIPEMARPGHMLADLYQKVKSQDLIEGACRACSNKMGVIKEVEGQGIPLLDEMSGHPSLGRYLAQGFQIVTM